MSTTPATYLRKLWKTKYTHCTHTYSEKESEPKGEMLIPGHVNESVIRAVISVLPVF